MNPRPLPELLGSLRALPAADRQWVVAALDPQERLKLIDWLDEKNEGAYKPVAAQPVHSDALKSATPAQLAVLLESEPSWIVNAILDHVGDPLRARVLRRFSAFRRAEIEQGRSAGTSIAPALADLVVRVAIRNLGNLAPNTPAKTRQRSISFLARCRTLIRASSRGFL